MAPLEVNEVGLGAVFNGVEIERKNVLGSGLTFGHLCEFDIRSALRPLEEEANAAAIVIRKNIS